MAFLGQEYSAGDLPEGNGDFEPVPAGWYNVNIAGAELKQTKAGTGEYISVRFDITGPTYQGRVVFTNLNIRNPNSKAEEIGLQQLGDILRAIGLAKVADTDQLIGGNLEIKVSVKDDPTYGPGNEVKAFKAIEGGKPPMPTASKPAEAKPATASAAPPWAK